jgi:hypothetical protein
MSNKGDKICVFGEISIARLIFELVVFTGFMVLFGIYAFANPDLVTVEIDGESTDKTYHCFIKYGA